MKLILLGPPGAGKGTQATSIVKEFDIVHISTGDIFRKNIKEETELGKKVKEYLSEGKLVPDSLTIDLVEDRLNQEDCKDSFLLDGFPRTLAQAEALTKYMDKRNQEIDKVINIEVDKDKLVTRLAGRRVCKNCGETYHIEGKPTKIEGVCDSCNGEVIQREDDKPETVIKRVEVYEKQTQPLVKYYTDLGKIFTVDGSLSIEEVFSAIKEEIA